MIAPFALGLVCLQVAPLMRSVDKYHAYWDTLGRRIQHEFNETLAGICFTHASHFLAFHAWNMLCGVAAFLVIQQSGLATESIKSGLIAAAGPMLLNIAAAVARISSTSVPLVTLTHILALGSTIYSVVTLKDISFTAARIMTMLLPVALYRAGAAAWLIIADIKNRESMDATAPWD